MGKSWLMCVLLGALAWGQAAPSAPPPAQSSQAPAGNAMAPRAPAAPIDNSAAVPAQAAVLTIKGVCPPAPKPAAAKAGDKTAAPATKTATAAKTSAADCKTVITRADFERLANGVAPNMTPQLKRQLASVLPRLVAMSQAAEKKGLDKSPRFKETLKFAKMQILTNELQRNVQEEASKISDKDIADYYNKNPEAYEQFSVERLFIPRLKQAEAETAETKENEKDEKLSEEQQKKKEADDKAKEEKGEQEMIKLAESLRARAVAGEDFMKLQKEAFEAAGMKIDSPTVNLPNVRRTGLPPGHAAVFDLKAGEVSQALTDSGGHYVYKVVNRSQLPVDQVKTEIHSTLQNQRTRDAMDKYQNSFQVETNEMYFGPPGQAGGRPGMPMPPRGAPRPNMAPSPTAPAPQGQPLAQPQAPQAQPPAPKPN
jgi:hypothetical protein